MNRREMEQIQTIPDDAPIVSIDVRLGRGYRNVDFDYDAYRSEAERLNMRPDSISALNIVIHRRVGHLVLGSYIPYTKTINLSAGENSNRILSHETSHAADWANGVGKTDARHIIGRLGRYAFLSMPIAIPAALFVNSYWGPSQSIINTVVVSTMLSQSAWLYGEVSHPKEMRARQAEVGSNHHSVILESRET